MTQRLSVNTVARLVQDRLRHRGVRVHNALIRVIVRLTIDSMHDQFPRVLEDFLETHRASNWWKDDTPIAKELRRYYSSIKRPTRTRRRGKIPMWAEVYEVLKKNGEPMRLASIVQAIQDRKERSVPTKAPKRYLHSLVNTALGSQPKLFERVRRGVWTRTPNAEEEFFRLKAQVEAAKSPRPSGGEKADHKSEKTEP